MEGKTYDLRTTVALRTGGNHKKRNPGWIAGGAGDGALIGVAAAGNIHFRAETTLTFRLEQPVTIGEQELAEAFIHASVQICAGFVRRAVQPVIYRVDLETGAPAPCAFSPINPLLYLFVLANSIYWKSVGVCFANSERTGRIMAMKCEYCGKGPSFGNVVSHANNTRRRRWNPNLKSVRALISGARKRVKVCTACIRAGKIKKAA